MQDGPVDAALGEEVRDEEQVGDEFAPGVVGDEAQGDRLPARGPGRGGREQGPQGGAVVGDEGFRPAPGGGARAGETEAEVGAVAPERAVQQGPGPFLGGQRVEAVERGEFLVGLRRVEFGELGGPERVDALPGAGAEVAEGVEEPAVEVALGPQPGHLVPGAADVRVHAPAGPAVPVASGGVGVGGQRLDHAIGAAREQGVERAAPFGTEGEGVAHLPHDGGVTLGEHAVREGPGFVAEDDGGGRGRGVGHARHRTGRAAPVSRSRRDVRVR